LSLFFFFFFLLEEESWPSWRGGVIYVGPRLFFRAPFFLQSALPGLHHDLTYSIIRSFQQSRQSGKAGQLAIWPSCPSHFNLAKRPLSRPSRRAGYPTI